MAQKEQYDYIIIGNGIAGFQLAIALSQDSFFNNKQIALIDESHKTENDKTISFWEKGAGKWDSIVIKSWSEALVFSNKKELHLKLHPYTYKTIHVLDFYKKSKQELSKKTNFHFIIDSVISVEKSKQPKITTVNNSYEAKHIFDSRIPDDYFSESNKYTKIIQHFKGWIIEVDKPVFKTDQFTMMDYRLKDGNQTTFTYVLPLSSTRALIEFTYFTPKLVEESTYDSYIKQYISSLLKIESYSISETESGRIPMTDFPFEKYSTKHITKIGTAAGWVKGSSGYSFKHTEKKVASIVTNLKAGNTPSKNLFRRKYKFYDKIFLKVLHDENEKGEWIFEQFYSKNSIDSMFRFLDEESTFLEDLKIMKSLFSFSFIKAFFKTL